MVRIRPELSDDVEGIHAVIEAAFPTNAEARLVDALRESGSLLISLVAEDQGELVGHIAFSPVSLAGATDGLGLAPLAVSPQSQRHGIGAQLVKAGLAQASESGAGFVVVLGDPAYYSRFGFATASGFGLSDQYNGGTAFQVIELRLGSIPKSGGLVEYAPEFALFEA